MAYLEKYDFMSAQVVPRKGFCVEECREDELREHIERGFPRKREGTGDYGVVWQDDCTCKYSGTSNFGNRLTLLYLVV